MRKPRSPQSRKGHRSFAEKFNKLCVTCGVLGVCGGEENFRPQDYKPNLTFFALPKIQSHRAKTTIRLAEEQNGQLSDLVLTKLSGARGLEFVER